MKKILLILILILSFQTWIKADDIRDFEIEGMSIGDSLLDYFSVEEMKSLSKVEYKSKKYARIILTSSNLDIYDDIDFYFRTNDKKYSMKAVVGGLYYEDLDEDSFKKLLTDLKQSKEIKKGSQIGRQTSHPQREKNA